MKSAQTAVLAALLLLIAGCSAPKPVLQIDAECNSSRCFPKLNDLERYPQDIRFYVLNAPEYDTVPEIQKHYADTYYRVWDDGYEPDPLEKVIWPFTAYSAKNAYGENLMPLPQRWFDTMLINADWQAYDRVGKRGIALQRLNLRNFPTAKPLFHDPRKAGEGFPFDYLQNSTVHPNEPLYISHYSADRVWVYVLTSYATGWVRSDTVMRIDARTAETWRQKDLGAVMGDGTPFYTPEGAYLFREAVGMLLPIAGTTETNGTQLNVMTRGGLSTTRTQELRTMPLVFNRANLTQVVNAVLQTKYGWGGYYGERDCSSTLRDIFAPFGIWLPRNSFQQSQVGEIIMLEGLGNEEKLERIRTFGVPFQTLLYLRGHVVLYLGLYNGEPAVLHTLWGIKTVHDGVPSRFIVGGTVISSLRIGNELDGYEEENSLLSKLISMNNIFKEAKQGGSPEAD